MVWPIMIYANMVYTNMVYMNKGSAASAGDPRGCHLRLGQEASQRVVAGMEPPNPATRRLCALGQVFPDRMTYPVDFGESGKNFIEIGKGSKGKPSIFSLDSPLKLAGISQPPLWQSRLRNHQSRQAQLVITAGWQTPTANHSKATDSLSKEK
jgi:hypothetical protein